MQKTNFTIHFFLEHRMQRGYSHAALGHNPLTLSRWVPPEKLLKNFFLKEFFWLKFYQSWWLNLSNLMAKQACQNSKNKKAHSRQTKARDGT